MAWPKEEDCTSYKPLENYTYYPPLTAPITSFTWADTTTDSSSAARLLGQYTLKPSPVLGHRADTVFIDDVSTPNYTEPSGALRLANWWTEIVNKRAKELREDIERQLIYGTGPIAKGIMKEKEMEIGGNKCHLCGSDILYSKSENTFHKKYVAFEKQITYECGTSVYDTYRERHFDPRTALNPEQYKKDRHIHAECI